MIEVIAKGFLKLSFAVAFAPIVLANMLRGIEGLDPYLRSLAVSDVPLASHLLLYSGVVLMPYALTIVGALSVYKLADVVVERLNSSLENLAQRLIPPQSDDD